MVKLISVLVANFLIMYSALYFIIKFINKRTNDNIPNKKAIIAIISILYSLAVDILYVKYFLSELVFVRCSLLMIYVTITGYIDHYTKNVYSFVSHVFLVIAIIFLGIDFFYYGDVQVTLIGMAGCFIISFILLLIKIPGHGEIIGSGDVEVFFITSIYIGGITSILNVFLACSFFAIGGFLKLIYFRRLNVLKNKSALCPFIAISTFMILLCM